ncbi:MAG: hypothetical protein ACI82F_000824 [Planctomycetota bacterium]|jgi:hypothetical protein
MSGHSSAHRSIPDSHRGRSRFAFIPAGLLLVLFGSPGIAQTPVLNEDAKLVASDADVSDRFGSATAIDGEVLVVGAPFDSDNGTWSGSAYVYRYDGTTMSWNEEAKLIASDGALGHRFGESLSISGGVIVVGAYYDDDLGVTSGSAYVYRYDDTTQSWNEEAKLLASDGTAGDRFAWGSVSIDGDRIVVGAAWDDDNGSKSGSAYVYRYDGTTLSWNEEAKLLATDGAADDWFGRSVSIDGETVVVGAHLDDDDGSGSGSAYVYRYDGTTLSWNQEAKLHASDPDVADYFGYSVSIDGGVIVAGAPYDDDNGNWSGSAYVYRYDGTTLSWNEEAKFHASDGEQLDILGWSVAVCGNTAVVGAASSIFDGFASGSAYVYRYDGTTMSWSEEAKLIASDGAGGDYFGYAVAACENAVIGAPRDQDAGSLSGSIYVFALSPPDADGDGLSDADEIALGTNPNNSDTDGDGLDDFTEVDIAGGGSCPDPLNPDSDGDTLPDGEEALTLGTDPCSYDTDGDGVPDQIDPAPTVPDEIGSVIEEALHIVALTMNTTELVFFNGPNANASAGRRNSLSNRCKKAAKATGNDNVSAAIAQLEGVLAKIDGDEPDWMEPSPEQASLAEDISLLIGLLLM